MESVRVVIFSNTAHYETHQCARRKKLLATRPGSREHTTPENRNEKSTFFCVIRRTLSPCAPCLKLSFARAISFPASPHAHTAHSTGMHVVVVVAPRRPRLVTRRLASRTHTTIVQPGTICSVSMWGVLCHVSFFVRASRDLRRPRPGNKAASRRNAGGREGLSTRLCPLQ